MHPERLYFNLNITNLVYMLLSIQNKKKQSFQKDFKRNDTKNESHSTLQRLNKKESHMLKESFQRDTNSIDLNNVSIDNKLMETIERIKTRKIHKKELDPAKYSKSKLKKVIISIYTNFLFKLL